jgi:hypothetical protein
LWRAFGIGKLKVNWNIYKINNNSIPCVTIGTDVRDLTYSNYSMPSITFPTSWTLESWTYNWNIILGKIEANESSDTNRYYATFTINWNLYYYDTARWCK